MSITQRCPILFDLQTTSSSGIDALFPFNYCNCKTRMLLEDCSRTYFLVDLALQIFLFQSYTNTRAPFNFRFLLHRASYCPGSEWEDLRVIVVQKVRQGKGSQGSYRLEAVSATDGASFQKGKRRPVLLGPRRAWRATAAPGQQRQARKTARLSERRASSHFHTKISTPERCPLSFGGHSFKSSTHDVMHVNIRTLLPPPRALELIFFCFVFFAFPAAHHAPCAVSEMLFRSCMSCPVYLSYIHEIDSREA